MMQVLLLYSLARLNVDLPRAWLNDCLYSLRGLKMLSKHKPGQWVHLVVRWGWCATGVEHHPEPQHVEMIQCVIVLCFVLQIITKHTVNVVLESGQRCRDPTH